MTVILCFGDSNTHGTLAVTDGAARARLPRSARWPSVAAAELGSSIEVIAEGHPGRTTVHPDPTEGGHKSGLACLLPLLETHRPIDVVVLMLGTNDLKHRFAMMPGDIAQGVGRLATVVATSGCGLAGGAPRLLIVSPAPIDERGRLAETFAGGAQKSRALAPHLARIAEEHGAAFLDAGGVVGVEVDPLDGIHLTEAAAGVLGRAIAQTLKGMGC
ncbi:MAG: SGNH/GDSL hydrolase family protein [Pseudomonadota bacterium]